MAPDVFSGECTSPCSGLQQPPCNLQFFKGKLPVDAPGCQYSGRLPPTCMTIDSDSTCCVDIVIDVAATGCCTDWQTVVMLCHLLLADGNKKSETTR